MSDKLKNIIEELKTQGDMYFLDAATEDQINEFEKTNDVKFPEQYREWLLFSDGGECFLPAGVQFYGVAHKPLINVNDTDRPDDTYVVIGALANGDPIVFKRGHDDISVYNQEDDCIEDDETYENFQAFLKDLYDLLGIGG